MSRLKYSREAVKQVATEDVLRQRIVSGTWGPGHRLPTHDELLAQFGISKTTIQRVVDRLADEGFLETRGGRGTFVSPRPPNLTDYAMVFHGTPEDPPSWGRFWQILSSSAKAIERTGERKFPQFYGVHGRPDAEDYQNLLRRLRSKALAGLIFASSPFPLTGDPILEEPGIPRVALMSPNSRSPIPAVTMDLAGLCDRAVDYLANRGRRHIASLFYASGSNDGHDYEDHLVAALQRRGLEQRPYRRQYVNVFHPTAVCRAVQVLLHDDQGQRPDALVVTDDTMLESVINGLFAAGVSVPRDVEVIAHANFPVAPTPMPIKRLGYDSRVLLQACIRLIDQQRRGESVPSSTLLQPQFDDEIQETISA